MLWPFFLHLNLAPATLYPKPSTLMKDKTPSQPSWKGAIEPNRQAFLTLYELEATSCFLSTVLLSFLNSGVSGHVALATKLRLKL